jgi:hypothetical protein
MMVEYKLFLNIFGYSIIRSGEIRGPRTRHCVDFIPHSLIVVGNWFRHPGMPRIYGLVPSLVPILVFRLGLYRVFDRGLVEG